VEELVPGEPLTPASAVKAYLLSNESEREQIRPIIYAKLARARTLWPEEKLALVEKMLGLAPNGATNGAPRAR